MSMFTELNERKLNCTATPSGGGVGNENVFIFVEMKAEIFVT
jgi:hypothetical protein